MVYLTTDDHISITKNCKKSNPLKIVRMTSDKFLGTETLETKITNRKLCEKKVNWLTTKEILLKKEDTYLIYMRKDFEEDYQILNIKKTCKTTPPKIKETDLTPLWPNGKEIAEVKLNDIKSTLEFIPMDARPFYTNLKGNRNIEDDVDGFSGTPDFHLNYYLAFVLEFFLCELFLFKLLSVKTY
ncbi:unnamed protein product [Euphydryas editha]|uniref:Uncharacterized protein n=1 Tax=Euphydryas editha TaxID=104508 RepID=A0AAU9UTA6_EUPED|nr:unnamed protein product [Euphydryas editha]